MATFTYAVRYQISAVCQTPLRTGGPDGDTETILRNGQNQAFLQGASVAGAFRTWLKEHMPADLEKLLGNEGKTGRLVVSDALFDTDAEQHTRPRLRLDPATGSAADGGKFDVAHIGAGAHFAFSLTWLGDRENIDELTTVEQMFAALNSGEIRLGAQKSNGFGFVTVETVTKRTFDMTDPQDRRAWLEDTDDGTALELPKAAGSQKVIFTVTGQADNILVRASVAEQEEQGEKGSYTPHLSENDHPLLPGSSVKGAVRARAEAIAKAMKLNKEQIDELFGGSAKDNDNGKPGQIWFEDVQLANNKKKIIRIRINKFTGGVIRSGLFKEEPVSSPVTLRISAPNDPLACALLLYALRDLGKGLYNLGSGGAIGRGYVAVQSIEAAAPDGRRAKLTFDGSLTCSLDDPDGLAANWLEVWGRCSA